MPNNDLRPEDSLTVLQQVCDHDEVIRLIAKCLPLAAGSTDEELVEQNTPSRGQEPELPLTCVKEEHKESEEVSTARSPLLRLLKQVSTSTQQN